MKWGTLFFNNGFPHAITTMANLMLHSMECYVAASAEVSIKPLSRMALKKLAYRSKCLLLLNLTAHDLGRRRLW